MVHPLPDNFSIDPKSLNEPSFPIPHHCLCQRFDTNTELSLEEEDRIGTPLSTDYEDYITGTRTTLEIPSSVKEVIEPKKQRLIEKLNTRRLT